MCKKSVTSMILNDYTNFYCKLCQCTKFKDNYDISFVLGDSLKFRLYV